MPKIISIHSFRRGTGKTTIAANLAVLLALGGHRVCLLDADVHLPGLHFLFGLKDEDINYSLQDYVEGKCRFEQTIYDVTPYLDVETEGRLFLVPTLATVDMEDLLRLLRQSYVDALTEGVRAAGKLLNLDALLIDVRSGITEETLAPVAISDLLYIILRLDAQDYYGAGIMVELAQRLHLPQVRLLVNEVLSSMDFAAIRSDAEDTFQRPVATVLPHAEKLMALAGVGIFVLKYPEHPWTLKLKQVAKRSLS